MDSFKCSLCPVVTKRSDNLKRHFKNVHGAAKNSTDKEDD